LAGRRSSTFATRLPGTGEAGLKPENRCLVHFNSFAEYAPEANPETKKKDVVWFALTEDRPLAAFAGIWTEFKGDIKIFECGPRAIFYQTGGCEGAISSNGVSTQACQLCA
jgi:hypothetical protein